MQMFKINVLMNALFKVRIYFKRKYYKSMSTGEPDLKVPDDDYFFAKFLRPCKWHAKPAFELVSLLILLFFLYVNLFFCH